MRAISAADAVSLAVQRTREFLFRPFNWGTYLKLGLVADHHGRAREQLPLLVARRSSVGTWTDRSIRRPTLAPEWIAAIVAAVLLAIVVALSCSTWSRASGSPTFIA